MNRLKIAHESPISLFEEVQRETDIDYCLVHLLEENKEYRDLFVNAVAMILLGAVPSSTKCLIRLTKDLVLPAPAPAIAARRSPLK